MEALGKWLFYLLDALVCLFVGYTLKTLKDRSLLREAETLKRDAERDAETTIREAEIAVREEQLKARDEFEKSTRKRREELQKLEERLVTRENNIERKAELLESKEESLSKRDTEQRDQQEEIDKKSTRLEKMISREIDELGRIASLSREDAKKQILDRLSESMEGERGALIRRFQEDNRKRLTEYAQEVMITSMQRYAGDCVSERTTSTILLPNDDMKGRIIGRDGRNIRAIEAATGVNVLIDDTPEAAVVSCFDPIRREVARIALVRLVSDGRIHPARIEDMVAKVKEEMDDELHKTGQNAVEEFGLTRVPENLVNLLGRLKYRFSYSQNVLQHSVEVARLMGTIAAQLDLDEQKAYRAGLFHDIGKAVDHEVEGSHAVIGADLLKRAREDEEVVNAVEAHHEDVEKNSLLAILVEICDTLSASRPGARSETTELYLKRLADLEAIGSGFEGVENCYAIQAGRELRVIVKPENIDENSAVAMARDMALRIEDEVRYPGQIKVAVIRETRAVEYAK